MEPGALTAHPGSCSLLAKENHSLVCSGRREFLACGTFHLKTRKIPANQDKLVSALLTSLFCPSSCQDDPYHHGHGFRASPGTEGWGQGLASPFSSSLVSSCWGLGSWSSKAGLPLPSSTSLPTGILCSCSRTAWAMGTIMAVVAVLLIHMDRKAVTTMKPRISLGADGQTHWCSSIPSGTGSPEHPPAPAAPGPGALVLARGNSQGGPHADDEEHAEGDAFVQIPVLHGDGHQHPPDE